MIITCLIMFFFAFVINLSVFLQFHFMAFAILVTHVFLLYNLHPIYILIPLASILVFDYRSMPMVWRKANSDVGLLLSDVYRTKHDVFLSIRKHCSTLIFSTINVRKFVKTTMQCFLFLCCELFRFVHS